MIRVASYNVLSDALCEASKFWKRSASDIDPIRRFSLLKQEIDAEIALGSILGLQEVSQNWRGKLQTYFQDKNYTFFCRNYGARYSDFMGVGIAVPNDKYLVEDVRYETISNLINVPQKAHPSLLTRLFTVLYDIFTLPVSLLRYCKLIRPPKKTEDPFTNAKRRTNAAIAAKLALKNEPSNKFWILTYHMPCAYYAPTVMSLHVNGIKLFIEKLRKECKIPVVLVGDFNIQPNSPQYNFITTGTLESEIPHSKDWTFEESTLQLSSAYKSFMGTEPDFTNYAWMYFGEESQPFISTLDYIFVSDDFKVLKAKELPSRTDADVIKLGDMPNEKNASDHLLIAAELSL